MSSPAGSLSHFHLCVPVSLLVFADSFFLSVIKHGACFVLVVKT